MWYNRATKNSVAPAMLATSESVTNESEFIRMSTVPHYALQDNPQTPYTVYVLLESDMPVAWENVRYVGLSTNVLARYAQHLACREADSNENKDEWIRGVLVSGKLPPVHEIEKLATIEEGREREQYWIRYAISQGAKLLNRQITMTEQEKIERHARRAARYARIEEMLESGIYVKREGVWYPTSLLYRHTASWPSLLSLKDTYIPTEQGAKSLMDASHEEFTAFIGQYITIFDNGAKHWDWFGRTSSIAYAQRHGATPEFCDPPPQPEKKSRKRKKNGAV